MTRPAEITLPRPPTRTLIEQDRASVWLQDVVGIDPAVVPVDGIRFTPYGVDVERFVTDADGVAVRSGDMFVREVAARITLTGPVPPNGYDR